MTVVDASVVIAALVDEGPTGAWSAEVLSSAPLAAPHLLPVEVASMLRRAVLSRRLSADSAALAHRDLLDLRIELLPYEPFGHRIWELRSSLTTYDAWYVALAEELDAPLATLDGRLTRAHGTRAAFVTPD